VTEQPNESGLCHFLRYVVDVMYPEAEKIVVVMDNLKHHTPGSLYEVFQQKRQ